MGYPGGFLLHHLEYLLKNSLDGTDCDLGPKTNSYREWVNSLKKQAESKRIENQQAFWQSIAPKYQALPVDLPEASASTMKDRAQAKVSLEKKYTELLLKQTNQAFHTKITDILLAALSQTIANWSNQKELVIGLENHGRTSLSKRIDVSSTVGWFTNLFPVAINTGKQLSTKHLIKSVKEQLREVPDDGMGYSLLRYLHPDQEVRNGLAAIKWDVVFNYLGQTDNTLDTASFFKIATESTGSNYHDNTPLRWKLEINSAIRNQELTFTWNYSNKDYRATTINTLAKQFLNNLEAIIAYCQEVQATEYTPSDFGLPAEVHYQELEHFLAQRPKLRTINALSPLQEGMLFHSLYKQGLNNYVEQFVLKFPEGLDIEAFTASWKVLLEHHTIFRTNIIYNELKVPVQCVYDTVELPFQMIDYSKFTAEEAETKVREFVASDYSKGFDLEDLPLMRISLIKTDAKQHTMVWTFHHIILDGWSVPLVMKELLHGYQRIIENKPIQAQSEDQYGQYIDFINTLNPYESEEFWSKYLHGFETPSLLPFTRKFAERNQGSNRVNVLELDLDIQFTEKLKRYVRKQNLTINTIVQAAWALLLSRYSGRQDVLYGVTVAGRPPELDEAASRIGLYINTIPLRTNLAESQTIVDWLLALQNSHSTARAYQYVELHKIQNTTGIKGDLFDSLVVFENYPLGDLLDQNTWSLKAEKVQLREQTNYLLTLAFSSRDHLSVKFNYNSELIDETYVKMISQHLENVLRAIVASESGATLSDIDLFSKEEQQRFLQGNNEGPVNLENPQTLVELLEQQIRTHPQNPAVSFGEEIITYQELDRRTIQLAHYLRKKGVGRNSFVGIRLDRSINTIVAIIGVLRAGGTYIPIDHKLPEERIAYLLRDTKMPWILTNQKIAAGIQAPTVELIFMDKDGPSIATEPTAALKVRILPNDLAYIIYTSGSTGVPKGVMIEHRGIANLALAQIKGFKLTPNSKTLQFSSLGFDASCSEIFTALCSGGQLVMAAEEDLHDPEKLVDIIVQQKIDVATIPPSLQTLTVEGLRSLKTLVSAGEALNTAVAKELMASGLRVINAYGPTENAVCVTLTDQPILADDVISIGKPIDNVSVYIMDNDHRFAPIGVWGEICVGGAQVARGYLNHPVLTQSKFKETKTRLYYTGDIGRWLPDGSIEYLGRKDTQVKIRGFRVELNEIEHVLNQHEQVRQSAVIAKAAADGNQSLIAFIVPDTAYDKSSLLAYLRTKLPHYMVPGHMIEIDQMPMNLNGKVDKKWLAEQDVQISRTEAFIEPKSMEELELAIMWRRLLGLEKISTNDNFFDLGGHSLLTTRLIAAIKDKFGLNLPLGVVYQYSTIAELANYIKYINSETTIESDNETQTVLI